MNIFVVNPSPEKCAERLYLVPKRANKMVTETQQILACCQDHFKLGSLIKKANGDDYKLPKAVYNHPVTKYFARTDIKHVKWLIEHLEALMCLYQGNKFNNVWGNIEMLNMQLAGVVIDDYDNLNYHNFAKSKEKELDFTHLPLYNAYNEYLKVQEA